jgi:hypothetical protein
LIGRFISSILGTIAKKHFSRQSPGSFHRSKSYRIDLHCVPYI